MKSVIRWILLLPVTQIALILFLFFLRFMNKDGFEDFGIYHTLTMAFIYGWIGAATVFIPYYIAPSHKFVASLPCSILFVAEILYCLYYSFTGTIELITSKGWYTAATLASAIVLVLVASVCLYYLYRE